MPGARWCLCLLLLFVVGCAPSAARRYYAIGFTPDVSLQRPPLPMKVWFQEVTIDPTYNRPQIVYRYTPYEIQYFANRLWADRPGRMIQQMVMRDLSSHHTFSALYDQITDDVPTHILRAEVLAIEELAGAGVNYAHLAMTLRLVGYADNKEVWRFSFDDRRPVSGEDTQLTVRALSEILQTQLEAARVDLYRRFPVAEFTPEEGRPAAEEGGPGGEGGAAREQGPIGPGPSPWTTSWQYNADTTVIPAGQGALFVPALSGDGAREPQIEATRRLGEEELTVTGRTGERLVLEPGLYTLHVGSGTLSQRMARQVRVVEGQVTVVEPFWSALEVEVLDSRFIPIRESYDLFRMDGREYWGLGFGADEEQGERTMIWLLPHGLYKIVQAGSTYRARTNFATVALTPGEFVRFGLVIEPASGDFLGAGVLEEDPEGEAEGAADAWRLSVSLGGDVQLTDRSEGTTEQAGTTISVSLFADNLVRYQRDPHLWSTRLELEEGQNRYSEGEFRNITDRAYLHSIYLYEVNDWFGPYARAGAETALFGRYAFFDDPTDVVVLDPTGAPVGGGEDQASVLLAPGLAPFEVKQGVGGNLQVVQSLPLELDLRVGAGSRQFLTRGEQVLISADDATTGAQEYQQVESYRIGGIEFTVVGTARLGRYVQARTELDGLLPRDARSALLSWRTTASLRLSSYASLGYTLDLTRDPNLSAEQPTTVVNSLQLRLFYAPF